MEATQSRGAVWIVLFVDILNSKKHFLLPKECFDMGIDFNAHPHAFTSQV